MLMTPIEVKVASLTPHGQTILETLQRGASWMNRTQIAEAIGKENRRLTQWEIAILDWLVKNEYAQARKEKRAGFIGWEWQYRAKSAE